MVLRWLAACALLSSTASAQSIGVYTDTEGTECIGRTTNGVLRGSVWVNLGGVAEGGFIGAQFRIDPTLSGGRLLHRREISIQWDARPTIVVGNPFDGFGVTLAYEACQTGSRVRLLTFTLVDTTESPIVILDVHQSARSAKSSLTCPKLVLCDGPVFTHVCVDGNPQSSDPIHWRAIAQPSRGVAHDSEFPKRCRGRVLAADGPSVRATSGAGWGAVKRLYR